MDNLIFSLNATIPIFLMMVLGMFFRKIGLFNENFITIMNKFVFMVAIPCLLFQDLSQANLNLTWDSSLVIFCFFATLISVIIAYLVSLPFRHKISQGEFIQGAYRSSAAVVGLAFLQNVYGDYTMATLMIVGAVPLYNIMAVIVLALFKPSTYQQEKPGLSKALLLKTLKGIITNPIILGIIIGLLWSILHIPTPVILAKTVGFLGVLTTPLGLMAMGAAFKFQSFHANIKPILLCCFFKLMGFVIIFLPLAVQLGFSHSKLIAILVMLGSATTASSYIMARNMGHDGQFTAGAVMVTTLGSAFTLTFWLYCLKTLNLT